MPDRVAELLLAAAAECGALQLFCLLAEVEVIAAGAAVTAAELCAVTAKNERLGAAIVAVCGEVSPRKLGKVFARWEGKDVASLRVDCIGSAECGILWRVSRSKLSTAYTRAGARALIAGAPASDERAHGTQITISASSR
jgi:hypothetical protein